MRRALDIVGCALLAPVLVVLGAIIATCVFLDSPGPVLYRSMRVGRDGRVFSMLKFRTMRHGSVGPSLSCFGDERYTPFGRMLALSRLDELPQIVNVVRGDMALVGPRPELQEFVDAYPDAYDVILQATPGLTGPAQLRFCGEGRILARAENRAEAYATSILPEKLGIDIDYVQNTSLRRDLELLAWTLLLPVRLSGDAFRAWRAQGMVAAPGAVTTLLAVASLAVMLVFSLDTLGGV